MRLFKRKKSQLLSLDRERSLSAKPALNRRVRMERGEDGSVILRIPRRDTAMMRTVSRFFRLPPYKPVALDELGSFVIELCDGTHTVRDIVDKFAERFKLNHREAEVSIGSFMRTLAGRSIIGLLIEDADQPSADAGA